MAVKRSGGLDGRSTVLKNLRREIGKIEGDISKGLKLGLSEIESDAVNNAPIEFGPLRASSFTDVNTSGPRAKGRVGFLAKYAPFVHEMVMINKGKPRPSPGKGVFWQGGGNKFLERAVKEGAPRLVAVIKRFAKR